MAVGRQKTCAGCFRAATLFPLPLVLTGSKLGRRGGLVPPDGAAIQADGAELHPRAWTGTAWHGHHSPTASAWSRVLSPALVWQRREQRRCHQWRDGVRSCHTSADHREQVGCRICVRRARLCQARGLQPAPGKASSQRSVRMGQGWGRPRAGPGPSAGL